MIYYYQRLFITAAPLLVCSRDSSTPLEYIKNEWRNSMFFNHNELNSAWEERLDKIKDTNRSLEAENKRLKDRVLSLSEQCNNLEASLRRGDYKIGGVKVTASMAQKTVSRFRKKHAIELRETIEKMILEAADKGDEKIEIIDGQSSEFIKANITEYKDQGFDVKFDTIYYAKAVTRTTISWHEKTEFEKLVDEIGVYYSYKLTPDDQGSEFSKLETKYHDELLKIYNIEYQNGSLIYTKR